MFKGRAKQVPLAIRQLYLKIVLSFNKGIGGHSEAVQARPELAPPVCQRGNDLLDSLVAEEFRQGQVGWVKGAAFQLKKVRRVIGRDYAIDGRVQIGSDREKCDLGHRQPIFIFKASNDSFVLEIRFF